MIFTQDRTAEEFLFQLDPGVYIIYNRVLSPEGQRLGMTFNGQNEPMTVTPLDTSSSGQRASTIIIISRITIPDIFLRNVWVIENYRYDQRRATTLQHIKPQVDQELEAGWGKAIVIMPVGNYVWGITKDGSAYTIKDGDKEISWSIHSATQGAEVVPVQDATGEKQRWVFHKVDTPLPC